MVTTPESGRMRRDVLRMFHPLMRVASQPLLEPACPLPERPRQFTTWSSLERSAARRTGQELMGHGLGGQSTKPLSRE